MVARPSRLEANCSLYLLVIQTIRRNEDRLEQGHGHCYPLKELCGRVSNTKEIPSPAIPHEFVDDFCLIGEQIASDLHGFCAQWFPSKVLDQLLQLAHRSVLIKQDPRLL